MDLNINVTLDWPSYEDDVNQAVRETILEEVRKEVRKQAGALRLEVAKQLEKKQKETVAKAIAAIGAV
jgi:hypothetical protein